MLRSELIEVVHSRRAFAFLGSGASIDAGAPSWAGLVAAVLDRTELGVADAIRSQASFRKAQKSRNFPACFSRIEQTIGRPALEAGVRDAFSSLQPSTSVIDELARWPFAGYVTTNYDTLLMSSLRAIGSEEWLQIGNTPDETRQVSGEISKAVWHIHGALNLDSTQSRLILTEEDYTATYAADSLALEQLRALLSQRRIVFIGFGFQDAEVMRVLKRVGALTSPARPLFAFVAREGDLNRTETRLDLRKYNNVDTLPYRALGADHSRLLSMLKTYGSYFLRRDLPLGQDVPTAPSYDPEATGLLIYNELCLKGQGAEQDTVDLLIRARILASIANESVVSMESLLEEVSSRAAVLAQAAGRDLNMRENVETTLRSLVNEDLVGLSGGKYRLTKSGAAVATDKAAFVKRMTRQFGAALYARAGKLLTSEEATLRVAQAADAFLKQCALQRSLGVALALVPSQADQTEYQTVALLQSLPKYMSRLTTDDEVEALSVVVRGVLMAPTDTEREYIGLVLQASFGAHLLGYDPATLRVRRRLFGNTAFVLDASTLIPFLAIDSPGYEAARFAIDRLRQLGSAVVTTSTLIEEVGEHARWAIARASPVNGNVDVSTLRAATGMAGQRENAFIQGLIAQVANGASPPNLWSYISKALNGTRIRGGCTDAQVSQALGAAGILCVDLAKWEGYSEAYGAKVEALQADIARARVARQTFTHDRQTLAEAEAVLIVEGLRQGQLLHERRIVSGAYFVSNTRIIDNIRQPALPITMSNDSVMHWSLTLAPCAPEELRVFTSELLSDLSQDRISIVDDTQLRYTFSPLASAAKTDLLDLELHHGVLAGQVFGVDSSRAFTDPPRIDLPDVLDSFNSQRALVADGALSKARAQLEVVRTRARVSEKERAELERLRAAEKRRGSQAASDKRAAASKSKGKKRKKPG